MKYKKTVCSLLSSVVICSQLIPAGMAADTRSRLESIEEKLPRLESLLAECEENNIPTDYETIDYTIIKKFIEYGREDYQQNYLERAEYIADKLEEMYNDTYNSLSSYLNGEKTARYADRYRTSSIQKDGLGYKASVTDAQTGEIKDGNVFFVGYMGYNELIDDIELLPDLGINMMGLEIGVNSIIIEPGSGLYGGWRFGGDYKNAGMVIEQQSGIGQNSSKGLRIINNGGEVSMLTSVQVKPNTEYEVGCVSRNEDGSGVVITAGDAAISVYNPSTRFATSRTSFTTGSSTRMTVTITSSASGNNILDNFFVREKNTYDNVLINGDFETETEEKNGLEIDAGAAADIMSSLQRAGESNIAADLLISPHYFPSFVLEEDASYTHGGSGFGGGGVEWYKERIKEVMSEYINALIPMVKDYPALNSVCLTNEPMFNLMYSEDSFVLPMWQQWLFEKYISISELNEHYGTAYPSFESVPKVTSMSQSQIFYDWKEFNEEMFADWHAGLAEQIKAIAPDLKVHAKMVDYLSRYDTTYESRFMLTGTDANLFSDFSDIHGNDAHAYLESTHMYQMQSKMEWYDYLTTIDEKPIHNSEDHIIKDQSKLYTDEQAKHVAADMWQGALHGRSSTTSWVYARTYDENSLLMDSLLHRPDVMSAIGETNLDLNRAAEEMRALQEVEPEVGVLFSTASRVYSRDYMNCLYKGYEALLYSGYRVSVLDDKAMADGKANGLKLLVIPDIRYASEEMLTALKSYAAAGGKILVLGEDSLLYDDYKKENPTADVGDILENAVIMPVTYSSNQLASPTGEEILSKVRELAPNRVKIIDKATGEELSKTDYRYTDYNGRLLINICRYEWDEAQIDIYIDGKKATQLYDVINETQLYTLDLQGYTPMLLYADTSELTDAENAKAVWKDGEFTITWSMPEDSNAEYMNIYITDLDGTRFLDKVAADKGEYVYKAEINGKTSFTLKSENASGYISQGITAELSNGIAASLSGESGKLILKGYSKASPVAYTVTQNGADPSLTSSPAAMGEIIPDENGMFSAELTLNYKADNADNFIIRVGNNIEKQVLYFTCKKTDIFENVAVFYNSDGYDILWKGSNGIEKIIIDDAISSGEYSPQEGFAHITGENVKKGFLITAVMNDGTQHSVRIPAPTPLSFICKVVDGEIRLTGIAQPEDEVVIMVSDGENILFTDSVTADSQGGFSDNFVLENDIPINSDTLLIIINTASNIGAEQEFIYTGSLPVHIDEGSGGYLIFTNYTRREIKDGSVVAAVYDGERLIDCYSFKIDIGAEETVEKLIERVQDGYRMKIYLWDSLSGARPLARALEM